MITVHVWNENTAQAGHDAHYPRGGDSTAYEFADAEEARNFAEGLRSARVHAGRDLFNARMATTIESYL